MKITYVDKEGKVQTIEDIQAIGVKWEKNEEDLKIYKRIDGNKEVVWDKREVGCQDNTEKWTDIQWNQFKVEQKIYELLREVQGQFETDPYIKNMVKGLQEHKGE